MAKFGQNPPVVNCKGGTFMCYAYGQKVWKFHGERSCDKMPGEDVYARPILLGDDLNRKRSIEMLNSDNRKFGRSTSTGSNSGSESECSSQPSPFSEQSEDVSQGFLSPASVSTNEEDSIADEAIDRETSATKLCPPPSPIGAKTKVDIKALNKLIHSLLKKHSLVQTGLEMLKQKPALALKLQQRRPRKVLADQGIIPPLKSPGVFHEQRQKLERARTGDFLNKKMQDRPERDYLVQKHILEDTSAYDSIVANQKELKKAQLVDDLNEKIFKRPGVFELVEKNILPADDTVAEALKDGNITYKKTTVDYEEDSSDAFSPEQPASNETYGSPPPTSNIFSATSLIRTLPSSTWTESKNDNIVVISSSPSSLKTARSSHTTAGHPYLIRQMSGSKSSKIASSLSHRNLRKKKEKPKFKKFKYHQYIPPDQQGKATEQSMPSMDTPYSRLLEQQQLYLQLQIMNQQYPTFIANQKVAGSSQVMDGSNLTATQPPPAPALDAPKQEKKLRTFTVHQLEEMKVAELKEELKARKEKVTGTKEVLIERLKRFAVPSPSSRTANQPISASITGLINATIQSTIRANTEQALAAAVNNNTGSSGAFLLKTASQSPPIQQKQEMKQESNCVTMMSMDTQQSQDQASTFHFAQNTTGAPILNANSGCGSIQLQKPTAQNRTYSESTDGGSSTSSSQPMGVQFVMNSNSNGSNPQAFEISERQKDDLLHKQQQEIESLKRIVELHRSQFYQRNPEHGSSSNSNAMQNAGDHPQQQHADMNNADQNVKRQHISQVLQKHLQNKLSSKDLPSFLNGLNPNVVKEETKEAAFSFSSNSAPPNVSLVSSNNVENPMSGTSQQTDDSPIILSIEPPVERSISENKDPPKYDQAIQMLTEKRRFSHQSFGSQDNMTGSPGTANTFNEVDDLLELLETKGEIPVTPTRQKPFPQVALIEGRVPQHATMHYHYGQQMHSRPPIAHRHSVDHLQRNLSSSSKDMDNMSHHPQRHSLEISSLMPMNDISTFQMKENNYQRRHSGDLLTSNDRRRHSRGMLEYSDYGVVLQHQENPNDFTSLLVSSAGDILMDSSHMPPTSFQGRVNHPNCMSPEAVALHQEPILSRSANLPADDPKNNTFLELHDPYANQPFSPMDTGTNDSHGHNGMIEERTGDPHLSSSSIHDSAHSLDKCLDAVPQNTKVFLRRYEQPLSGASPQRQPSHLIKSSSQELLTGHIHGMEHNMQVDDLGWLDLNLTSVSPAPSPMNLQHQNRQSMHSSMGSILEQDTNCNPYGFGSTPNEFDLIDSLDLNAIGTSWDV